MVTGKKLKKFWYFLVNFDPVQFTREEFKCNCIPAVIKPTSNGIWVFICLEGLFLGQLLF